MIDRKKLHKYDRMFGEWVKAVAGTKDKANEIVKLGDEITDALSSAEEKLLAVIYINPMKEFLTRFMDEIKDAAKFAEEFYGDTEAENE